MCVTYTVPKASGGVLKGKYFKETKHDSFFGVFLVLSR